ncbi:MAG: tetratricopeptide repeat protein [Anaerolineae bacterium]|jgi:tetratricopeptide (TPR) repeat protein|nr:tetratricopeptide repeat protein [Anaerolineae bacterium]MBT7075204.1 tetratricopeptide repeat protein [Anaerolineae bacterium]MBT7783852.1 tetratricopeptide repeat protein [Anaerolineae bacterium]
MAENTMLQEAIDAIRQGEKAKAKDILTRLLKADQHNANYWVWMSAAVETQKERVYALKTALRADPKNVSAKRGLVLLGKLPPDENIAPFPLHHPRLWEEDLSEAVDEGEEKETGVKGFIANPIVRLAAIGLGIASIIGFAIFGLSQRGSTTQAQTVSLGPTATYTHTPTSINAQPVSTQPFLGATPLSALLDVPYTPTPLYVNTPRSVQASDYGNAVKAAYRDEDWEALIAAMEQIIIIEPESADPYYYIGEAYRFMGENGKAFNAYEEATSIDKDFGPAYLGKARVYLYINASADIGPNLNRAIDKDPYFAEAYIDRANYWLKKEKLENALEDIEDALQLSPDSPMVYFTLAKIYWAQDELEDALNAAEKALELDLTHLETYFLLGQLHEANDQIDEATEVLEIYVAHEEENAQALAMLGGAYYANKKYDNAIEILDRAIELDRRSGTAHFYRGLSYLFLKDGEAAVDDLDKANRYLSDSFEASIALAQAEALRERYGNCFLQVQRTSSLAEGDYEEALTYYWLATCHEGREDFHSAQEAWEDLLEIPESSAIRNMQREANEHLAEFYTPTPTETPSPTKTPLPSRTPKPTD